MSESQAKVDIYWPSSPHPIFPIENIMHVLRVMLSLALFPPIESVTVAQSWPVRVPQVSGHCIRSEMSIFAKQDFADRACEKDSLSAGVANLIGCDFVGTLRYGAAF